MDPLSLTANIAAVIGLLDAVCRLGKETHKVISGIKHAPDEVKRLNLELEGIDSLLISIHKYCLVYQRQHPLMVAEAESNSTISHLFALLHDLQMEYEAVIEIVERNTERPNAGMRQRLRYMGNRVKLVFAGDLKVIFERLSRYKAQLSINLQVLAGFNDLAKAQSPLPEKGYIGEHHQSPKVAQRQDSTSLALSSCWVVNEGSLDLATLPLMLLKPKIQEALSLLTLCQPGQAHLSNQDTNWIQEELESLRVGCHETAAVTLKSPNSTFNPNASHTTQTNKNTECVPRWSAEKARQIGKTNEITTTKFLVRESPAGNVSVRIQCIRNPDSGHTAVSDIILLLTPNPAIHKHGFVISLARLNEKLRQPRIHRSISMYTVAEPDSPIFECVQSNNIARLRQFLGSRQATPDIRNTENESLLSVAARHLRLEICELLINEGADPSHCRSDGANAIYAVRTAFWYRDMAYKVPKSTLNQLLRLFVRAGCDMNSVALGGSPLHFTVSYSLPGSVMIDEEEISCLVNLLVCLGCDIEHDNSDGLTPLLYNACIPGLHGVTVLKELLNWGANPHAQTHFGEGALHLAIAFSIPGTVHGDVGFRSLQARLALLLNAGCDPNLRDRNGHTVSDYAMSSPRTWFQWCLAVEKNQGLPIEEILRKDDNPGGYDAAPSNPRGSSNDCRGNEGLESDWESCSDSDTDDDGAGTDSTYNPPLNICSDYNHPFLSWNGFFPWSISPSCWDCALPVQLQDISRKKWQGLHIFKAFRS
ncbi:hypothetical protein N7530_005572 [Penicillium desertorum]|uniref:Fungal N-terminal domain-containing protein n=1 Tax=Penicillium desertorum TaxID=1303715 RepID=A0A9W9X090_9EURO|nr:hypothetical protein N7530_005572 [Penicillium desertorum]